MAWPGHHGFSSRHPGKFLALHGGRPWLVVAVGGSLGGGRGSGVRRKGQGRRKGRGRDGRGGAEAGKGREEVSLGGVEEGWDLDGEGKS
ncbi:hypothetical protein BSKO_09365 [Bryopsis sp. KO-2023]|nr:hypothetical protein BSKO_09365 [Bryopsis sp. KO-2023]